jgi:hypothetical protein
MDDIFTYFSDPLNVRKCYHKLVLGWACAGILNGLFVIASQKGLGTTWGLCQLLIYSAIAVWMLFEVRADNGIPYVNRWGVALRYLLVVMCALSFAQDFTLMHSHTGLAAITALLFLIADAIILAWTFWEIKKTGLYKQHFEQARKYADEFTKEFVAATSPNSGPKNNPTPKKDASDNNRLF